MMLRWAAMLGLLLVAPLLAACGTSAPRPPLRVVATIAPLADWARQIGRERAIVTQIVPVDADPQSYTPTPADVAALRDADVLISNGLGLEPWLPDLLAQAQPREVVALEIGQYIGPRATRSRTNDPPGRLDDMEVDEQQSQSRVVTVPPVIHSPYLWLDPGMAQVAVTLIGDTFIRADPERLAFYRRNVERYNGELENLDVWVRRQIKTWPRVAAGGRSTAVMQAPDRSWYYFTARYGLELRLTSELATRHPILPSSTPLFVNGFGSEVEQAVPQGDQRPAGVLRPLGHASYVQLIRQNVRILTSGAHRAARELERPWTRSNNES